MRKRRRKQPTPEQKIPSVGDRTTKRRPSHGNRRKVIPMYKIGHASFTTLGDGCQYLIETISVGFTTLTSRINAFLVTALRHGSYPELHIYMRLLKSHLGKYEGDRMMSRTALLRLRLLRKKRWKDYINIAVHSLGSPGYKFTDLEFDLLAKCPVPNYVYAIVLAFLSTEATFARVSSFIDHVGGLDNAGESQTFGLFQCPSHVIKAWLMHVSCIPKSIHEIYTSSDSGARGILIHEMMHCKRWCDRFDEVLAIFGADAMDHSGSMQSMCHGAIDAKQFGIVKQMHNYSKQHPCLIWPQGTDIPLSAIPVLHSMKVGFQAQSTLRHGYDRVHNTYDGAVMALAVRFSSPGDLSYIHDSMSIMSLKGRLMARIMVIRQYFITKHAKQMPRVVQHTVYEYLGMDQWMPKWLQS